MPSRCPSVNAKSSQDIATRSDDDLIQFVADFTTDGEPTPELAAALDALAVRLDARHAARKASIVPALFGLFMTIRASRQEVAADTKGGTAL